MLMCWGSLLLQLDTGLAGNTGQQTGPHIFAAMHRNGHRLITFAHDVVAAMTRYFTQP